MRGKLSMYKIRTNDQKLVITGGPEIAVAETINVQECQFIFDKSWAGLTVYACFKNQNILEEAQILLDDTYTCKVPASVTMEPGNLYVGLLGVADGNIVKPTVWQRLAIVLKGVSPTGQIIDGNPTAIAELTQIANEAMNTSSEAKDIAQEAHDIVEEMREEIDVFEAAVDEKMVDIDSIANEAADISRELQEEFAEFLDTYQKGMGISQGFGEDSSVTISQKTITDNFYNNLGENKIFLNEDIKNPDNWTYTGITNKQPSAAYYQLEDSIYYGYNPGTNKRISNLIRITNGYAPVDKENNQYAIQITPKTNELGVTQYAFYGFYEDNGLIVADKFPNTEMWASNSIYIDLSKYIKFAIVITIDNGTSDGAVLNKNNLNDYITVDLFEARLMLQNKEYIVDDDSAITQKIYNKYGLTNKNVVFTKLETEKVWGNYSYAYGGNRGWYTYADTNRLCTISSAVKLFNISDIKFLNIVLKGDVEYILSVFDETLQNQTKLSGESYIRKNGFYDISNFAYLGLLIRGVPNRQLSIDEISDLVEVTAISINENNKIITKQWNESKIKRFNQNYLLNGEGYIFFTDPHIYSNRITATESKRFYETILTYYKNTPAEFIVNCGDVLQGNTPLSKNDTVAELVFFNSIFNKNSIYLPVFGNHDDGSYNNPSTTLTQNEINNAIFKQYDKSYYRYPTRKVNFIVLDSGSTNNFNQITGYRYEQLLWLKSTLEENQTKDVAVFVHQILQSGNVNLNSDTYRMLFMRHATKLMDEFNNRNAGSLVISGYTSITYDFSNTTGRVRYVSAGHRHKENYTLMNNIPVFLTTKAIYENSVPTFDLCYHDMENDIIYLERIGYGKNRVIRLSVQNISIGNNVSETGKTLESENANVINAEGIAIGAGPCAVVLSDSDVSEIKYYIVS